MQRNPAKLTGLLFGVTAVLCVHWTQAAKPARAHSAAIEVHQQAVEIVAAFETGEPMANAQVSIYAPNALDEPWQTGKTDSEGRFLFAPSDRAAADDGSGGSSIADGTWEVTVRKAGHGQTATFELGAIARPEASSAASPVAQKWLSIAAILWGFLGTALYFSRNHKHKPVSVSLENLQDNRETDSRETAVLGMGSDR